MEEGKSIKETQEFIKMLGELVVDLGVEFKDGIQLQDFIVFASKVASKDVYKKGIEGMKEIIPEMKDLKVEEIVQIVIMLITDVPRYIELFRAKKAMLASNTSP